MGSGRRALALALGLTLLVGAAFVADAVLVGRSDHPTAAHQLAPGAAPPEQAGWFPAPTLGADGLWIEPWYRETTWDLAQDAKLAAGEGKLLAVFWERQGCQFCLALHTIALRMPELHGYVADRFYVVRLDFLGERPVRDFDGYTAPQFEIASRHRAPGTPTIEFREGDGKEVLRIPGYVEPPTLLAAFEFADTRAYRETTINAWLKARGLI